MLKKLKAIPSHVLSNKGWYFLLVIFLIGIALFVFGKYALLNIPSAKFSAELSLWLGALICGSGVSGAVLKIIATENFFLDAVADVVHGPSGIMRLSQEKLQETWVELTRVLYLSNMKSDHESSYMISTVKEMRSEFEKVLNEQFPSSQKHFVNSHSRTLSFSWKDQTNGVILIDDVIISTLIPFHVKEDLTWESAVYSDHGQNIDENIVKDISCELIPNSAGALKKATRLEGGRAITTFVSDPKEKHEIRRHREWCLPILLDPNFFTATPFLVRQAEVKIDNKARGLRIIFRPIGHQGHFDTLSGKRTVDFGQNAHFRSSKMILPEQGYALTMMKLVLN